MYTGTYPFRELKRCLSWSSVELLLCTWSKVNKDTTQLPLNTQKTAFFVSQTPCKIASFPGYWGGGLGNEVTRDKQNHVGYKIGTTLAPADSMYLT